jgi:hypothetical protein
MPVGANRRSPLEELFIGEIVSVYSEERYLTDGLPDLRKINPFMLITPQKMYATIGPDLGAAWGMDNAFKNKK